MANFLFRNIQANLRSVRKSQAKNGEILVLPYPNLLNLAHRGAVMEISFEFIICIFLILLIMVSAFMLYREFSHVNGRVGNLETRVQKLEAANPKRLPWQVLEELEHARAALSREKEEREFHLSLIENAETWIGKAMSAGTKREGEK